MEFLKQIVLAQSAENMRLILVLAGLCTVTAFPYMGFLLGSSALSLFCKRRGRKDDARCAKDIMDLALANKSMPTFLAIIPVLSLTFLYAQLLQESPAISVGLMLFAFAALLASVILLYSYKVAFRLSGILGSYEGLLRKHAPRSTELGELEAYEKGNIRPVATSGRNGLILLVVATFLSVAGSSIATVSSQWEEIDTVFDLFVSPLFLIRYLVFLAVAVGVTGVGILSFGLRGAGRDDDEEYRSIVTGFGVRWTAVSFLALPLLVFVQLLVLPDEALSGVVFGGAGLFLLFLLLSANSLYAFTKREEGRYAAGAFYLFMASVVVLFSVDQVAVANATRSHAVAVAAMYEKGNEALKSRLGIAQVAMTGEDLYNAKCSACHLYDQKKVGPAYRDVLPKYDGRKSQLITFVLNPVKVDAAYPPMPNQGLKPAEADSVVTYLLSKYALPKPDGQSTVKPQ